jgi:hypothetical protein
MFVGVFLMFASPCGVKELKPVPTVVALIVSALFPSPCGVKELKLGIIMKHLIGDRICFRPLAG